jgi:hypothetical protein
LVLWGQQITHQTIGLLPSQDHVRINSAALAWGQLVREWRIERGIRDAGRNDTADACIFGGLDQRFGISDGFFEDVPATRESNPGGI